MKKVFLTGAAGFIGSHSLKILLEYGYEVHAISSKKINIDPPKNLYWHTCDLLNHAETNQLINTISPSHLLHFAWYVEPGKFWSSPLNLKWVQASINLIESFAECGGKRAVFAGSCTEYDLSFSHHSAEKTPCNPSTLYGTCKNALRQIFLFYSKQFGLSCAWGRIFYLYGPHESTPRFVPSLILSLLRKEILKCSHGNQVRDYMHVEDVASAFVRLLNSDFEGPVNIASGEGIALKNIGKKIAERLGNADLLQFGALTPPLNEPEVLIADVNPLKEKLGWRQKYNIDSGLEHTIDWWKKKEGCHG